MISAIRFHLDESVSDKIAVALRLRGVDVTVSGAAGLIGAPDEEQFAFSGREGRSLVTHDDDFLRIARLDARHSGIIYCRPGRYTLGEIVRRLSALHETMDSEDIRGRVVYL